MMAENLLGWIKIPPTGFSQPLIVAVLNTSHGIMIIAWASTMIPALEPTGTLIGLDKPIPVSEMEKSHFT